MRIHFGAVVFTFTLASLWHAASHAEMISLQVKVENLAPTNSISFAPLRFGVGNGTYDSFTVGQAASAAIISIAEGGSGADWFPAFQAAEPNATLGSAVPDPAGPLLPGQMGMGTVMVDTAVNKYFTFASMAVPSNDYFIGNDSPTQYMLFDGSGMLNLSSITLTARDLWDAGSEAFDPANAAFVGNNSLRTPQNGVVRFDFAELAGFNGLTTAPGYTFQSQLTADTPVYRISFAAVPEPASAGLLGICGMALHAIRRRLLG